MKNPTEVLQRIVHAVSMGGNMVVNFGPQADGDFRPEEKELAAYLGKWMRKNGEAIYGCDYAGLAKQDWGYYTRNGNSLYMIVFNEPYPRQLCVKTPKGTAITGAALLDGTPLAVKETTNSEYNVAVPAVDPGEPYVIKLSYTEKDGTGNKYREALT